MKKAIAIVVALLFVLSMAVLSLAAEEKKAPMAPVKAEEKKPAEKMVLGKAKEVTGEVAAVDATAKTLTVKGEAGDVALTTGDKTTVKVGKHKKALSDIKVGDKAAVKYAVTDGKNVAQSIFVTPAPAKAEKKEAPAAKEAAPAPAPKAEEKKPAPAPAEKKKTGGY